MPLVKAQHVASVSSEDTAHPADNLLSPESYRKWKCAAAGEKKAIVVLQLEKATQLYSIDVGNEGSAFVEILVGRSSTPDSYEVLLGMSTFMTPADSKQWSNTNRVRMFGKDKFSKGVSEQKWDRVKLVCTQPYNKSEKYGLSFVKLHSPPEATDSGSGSTSPKKLGVFSIKEETKDLPSGSLFFRREQKQQPSLATSTSSSSSSSSSPSTSTAAQARMASTAAAAAVAAKTDQSEQPSRGGVDRSSDLVVKKKVSSTPKTERKRGPTSMDTPPTKRAKSKEATDSSKPSPSIAKLLEDVVFTLSGFKNPFRGTLRQKAIDMGAQYQPDWSPDCTHLICAFPNTPKFNQVKAKNGAIVRKEWVLDCHAKQRKLPSKSYRLTSGDSGDSSTSEEEEGEGGSMPNKPASGVGMNTKKMGVVDVGVATSGVGVVTKKRGVVHQPNVGVATSGESAVRRSNEAMVTTTTAADEEEDPYGGSTDEESDAIHSKPRPSSPADMESSCSGDTDDEINRVLNKQVERTDPYGGSTDEGSDAEGAKTFDLPVTEGSKKRSLLDLPEFFSKFNFFLYGKFPTADRQLIVRYITAYAGTISEYMNDKVTHVVTLEKWDANFDQALSENSSLAFVKPSWIFHCHQTGVCTPHQPFIVAPC